MFDWCIALADYFILCWWNIVCVDNVYLLTRCHLILSFIRYVQWYGMNGIWLSRWIYQTPPKIYFWSKVRSSIGKHDVIMNFDLRKNKLRNLCFNFFFSTSMWPKWIYSIHWREYCYWNGTMASFRVWLLWIFWWYPSDW